MFGVEFYRCVSSHEHGALKEIVHSCCTRLDGDWSAGLEVTEHDRASKNHTDRLYDLLLRFGIAACANVYSPGHEV